MTTEFTEFDNWLRTDGPVALVIREPLEPVTGAGTVFFPPTYPLRDTPKGMEPDYVIDDNRVCLVDSVGSQGNRLEPMFKRPPLEKLVPQITVAIGERKVHLLDAGHRAADAVLRFSQLGPDLEAAFLAYRDQGDATKLAKIAPTSLVFGAWDSRGTGAKVPRLLESTVRAFGVERLTRSAQYFALMNEEERARYGADSAIGLVDTPAKRTVGGVIAKEVRRDAVLNLVALRSVGGGEDSLVLQRYILGLALAAFLAPAELYLRQGCLLVPSGEQKAERVVVMRNGERRPVTLTSDTAMRFADEASNAFGVGEDRNVEFEESRLEAAKRAEVLKNEKKEKKGKGK